jgi:hypothetical protein
MILPHALFVSAAITIKVLFPSIVKWLATDTYAIYIFSQLYPWIWTVALLFQYRHGPTDGDIDAYGNPELQPTPAKKSTALPKSFSRATPRTPTAASAVETPKTPVQRLLAAGRVDNYCRAGGDVLASILDSVLSCHWVFPSHSFASHCWQVCISHDHVSNDCG